MKKLLVERRAVTAWRRTRETIRLLAARAPSIRDALQHAKLSRGLV